MIILSQRFSVDIILVTRIQYRSTVEAISTPSALIVERK